MEPCPGPGGRPHAETCPGCGHAGFAVARVTLKALLLPAALARLPPTEHRFCPSRSCDVVYFGREEAFRCDEVRAPVFQKLPAGHRTVCHCLEVGEDRIAHEVATTGSSPSAERIKQLVEAGRCACEVRNPQGSCCLGQVMELLRSAGAGVVSHPRRSMRGA